MSSQAQNYVEFEEAENYKISKGQVVTITLSFKILEGYHIQSESKLIENIIPTEIIFDNDPSFEILFHEFIIENKETVILNQFEHEVLVDQFKVRVKLKLSRYNLLYNKSLNGYLNYQACTAKQCLFPRRLDFKVSKIQENTNKTNT